MQTPHGHRHVGGKEKKSLKGDPKPLVPKMMTSLAYRRMAHSWARPIISDATAEMSTHLGYPVCIILNGYSKLGYELFPEKKVK